jgi:hypothetical protein
MPEDLGGKVIYGSYNDGSVVFKDRKGYYIVAVTTGEPFKKYIKGWKPGLEDTRECLVNNRWKNCTKKKKRKTTRKN